ncbi:MAG: hypothetical protein ACQGVK_19420 [Myxococcota bacterium]
MNRSTHPDLWLRAFALAAGVILLTSSATPAFADGSRRGDAHLARAIVHTLLFAGHTLAHATPGHVRVVHVHRHGCGHPLVHRGHVHTHPVQHVHHSHHVEHVHRSRHPHGHLHAGRERGHGRHAHDLGPRERSSQVRERDRRSRHGSSVRVEGRGGDRSDRHSRRQYRH